MGDQPGVPTLFRYGRNTQLEYCGVCSTGQAIEPKVMLRCEGRVVQIDK